MKTTILLLLSALSVHLSGVDVDLTKAGVYTLKGDVYELVIYAGGTKSEKRIGKLRCNDLEITGDKAGDVRETKFGKMCWFGATEGKAYNRGWLRYTTYDKPVFHEDGSVVNKFDE